MSESSASSVVVSPVLVSLRAATALQHKRLEARLPFFTADFTVANYKKLLAAYYGFYQSMEAQVTAVSDLLPTTLDWSRRQNKSNILRQDLLELGFSPAELADLPVWQAVPVIDSMPKALGMLYVIEGATLGGQVLKRRMAEKLGIDAFSGGAFLDVYGADTGRLWRSFMQCLAAVETPDDCEHAALGATQMFACFETWLESQGVLQPAA